MLDAINFEFIPFYLIFTDNYYFGAHFLAILSLNPKFCFLGDFCAHDGNG